jgi:hypothetical protein
MSQLYWWLFVSAGHHASWIKRETVLHHLRLFIPFSPTRTILSVASTMSTFQVNPPPSSSSNFQEIFSAAVKAYEKRTKKDILVHPLTCQLQACNSPASVLAVLQSQVDELDGARKSDERMIKWLGPTINVLLAFSDTLGEGISLVSVQCDIVL